ncbi:hypothetical protein A8F94_06045 [Bacillus sp. FJAT-27225]|nr:hypothetical protein A8F94_06045 [Bacillus sp. FJAT-27225]
MFQGSQEEDAQDDTIHKNQDSSNYGRNKETIARVAYEYPKGNFRFPLIPDQNSSRKTERPVQKQHPIVQKPVKETKIEPVSKERPAKKVRPFTPTEIPSPVFGYSRSKKGEPIEYELNGFLTADEVEFLAQAHHDSTEVALETVSVMESHSENGESVVDDEMDQSVEFEAVKDHIFTEDPVSHPAVNVVEKLVSNGSNENIHDNIEELKIENSDETENLDADEPVQTVEFEEEAAAEWETSAITVYDLELVQEAEEVQSLPTGAFAALDTGAPEATPTVLEMVQEPEEVQSLLTGASSVLKKEAPAATATNLEMTQETEEVQSLPTGTDAVQEIEVEAVTPTVLEIAQEIEEVQSLPNGTDEVQEKEAESVTPNVIEAAQKAELIIEDAELPGERQSGFLPPQNQEHELKPIVVDLLPEEKQEVASIETETQKKDTERPKRRSHLPFNVLMLKQDREKLGQQQKPVFNPLFRKDPSKPAPTENQVKQESKSSGSTPVKQEGKILADTSVKQADSAPIAESKLISDNSVKQDLQEDGMTEISDNMAYRFPDIDLLDPPIHEEEDPAWLESRREMLEQTLHNFNVGASVVNVTQGPSVTRFEVHPDPGVKVNKVTNLSDDIKLSLAARDIRIEAPIPGKHTIGIEVPNPKSRPVMIREIIDSNTFMEKDSPLTAVLGLDISGNPIVTDLKKMPHGLIAGATGSGKSVCINSLLVSLLYKASPDDLKLLLIDPKMVELAPYNRIPHLVSPVITDVKAATAALKWAVEEMERRYELFAHAGVREITRYNDLAMQTKRYAEKLPFIVIVIDELADLMMMSPADVEEAICRIAQKARACGIHLIIATQRPSVDVITGLIKANVPTRIAFSVSSQVDSRTIIDIGGAEKLLGRGDMLFLENGSSKPVRLQGTFVTDDEIDKVASFTRGQRSPNYLFEQEELLKKAQVTEEEDELFLEACEFVVGQGGASTSSLQRRFKVGYNRAARLIDMMEEAGYISGARGSKPRDVLITETELETLHDLGRR